VDGFLLIQNPVKRRFQEKNYYQGFSPKICIASASYWPDTSAQAKVTIKIMKNKSFALVSILLSFWANPNAKEYDLSSTPES
jgi:hypothetical protein